MAGPAVLSARLSSRMMRVWLEPFTVTRLEAMPVATSFSWKSDDWRRSDGDSPLAETMSRGTNDPERDLIAIENERLVQQALLKLPEPLRVAILLHDYQGLGHDEIAALTGVNHTAARKRYSRALAALARLLKDSLG